MGLDCAAIFCLGYLQDAMQITDTHLIQEKDYENHPAAIFDHQATAAAAAATPKLASHVTPFAADTDWIQTTHTGSLPHKSAESVKDIVQKQISIGLSYVNDGEISRTNFLSDLLYRINGIGLDNVRDILQTKEDSACSCVMPCAADMRDVPEYAWRFSGANGLITLNPRRPAKAHVACVSEPKYTNEESLYESLSILQAAIGDNSPSSGFYTAPSPGTVAMFCEDKTFQDYNKYVFQLANVIHNEYAIIARHGFKVQVCVHVQVTIRVLHVQSTCSLAQVQLILTDMDTDCAPFSFA